MPSLSGSVGVTREEYTEDDYRGSRFTLDETPLAAFADPGTGEALAIVRSGDRVVLTGAIDLTGASEESAEQPVAGDEGESSGDISVQVTFPGEVLSHNGEQNGRTVVWTTELDRPITLEAESEVDEGRDFTLLWVGMIVTAMVALAIVIVVVSRRRRRVSGVESQQAGA